MFTLDKLADLLAARAASTAEKSYTKSLLDAGPARAAKKFGEEAVELVIAAVEGETGAIRSEAADVLYHLMVVLRTRGIELQDVLKELETRTTRSGHEEKASRKA